MEKTRLLLIEDNRLLRDKLTGMLQRQPDIEIAASMENPGDAMLKALELKPHIVLMTMSLGDHNSLNLADALSKEVPEARVVVMGLIPTQEDVLDFVRVGACGFILKDTTLGGLLTSIRSVARGDKVLPPSLTGSLFSQIVEETGGASKPRLGESMRMSRREREVMELIAQGLSNKEIAQRLHLTVYTVKSHVHKILERLALRTRVEIANYARGRRIQKPKPFQ